MVLFYFKKIKDIRTLLLETNFRFEYIFMKSMKHRPKVFRLAIVGGKQLM